MNTPTHYFRPAPDRLAATLLAVALQLSFAPVAHAGGWLTGTKAFTPTNTWTSGLSQTSILPTYNNVFFNDTSLVGAIHNDPIRTPSTKDPVSTVSGNNFHDETDLVIAGREGLNYVFTRTYNSESRAKDRGLGYGWSHSYLMRLKSNDAGRLPNCQNDAAACPENNSGLTSSITYTDERGGDSNYLVDEANGQAVSTPPGNFDSLTLDSPAPGQNTLRFRNGVQYVFENLAADGKTLAPGASLKTAIDVTARLKRIEAPHGGLRLDFGYDANGKLSTVTDNLDITGRSGLVLTYDANGRLKDLSDWTGRKWAYAYTNGELTSLTNPLNHTLSYTYWPDSRHLLNEIVKPLARDGQPVKTAFKYYQNGRAFNQTDSYGLGDTLDYDLYRKRTRVTDALGGVREYAYDANGGLVQLNEPDGAILQFANQADTLRYQKRDALGHATTYSYRSDHSFNSASDTGGNVTREEDTLGQTVDTTYGPLDQIATVTDPRGTTTTTAYAPSTTATASTCGDYLDKPQQLSVSQLTGASGVVANPVLTTWCWNPDASLNTQRSYLDTAASRWQDTRLTYQPGALLVREVQVLGSDGASVTKSYSYDDLGRKLTETLQRRTSPSDATLIDLTTTYDYDALGRVVKTTDPLGNEAINRFDANGQLWQVTHRYKQADGTFDERNLVTRTFDAAERVKTETDAMGHVTTYQYDAAGNPIAVTDPEGHTTRFEYDAMNRKTAVIGATGYRTETTYNQRGEAVAVTNANTETVKIEIDPLGRPTAQIDPLGHRTETQYDANGNPICVIDANAQAGLQPKNTQGCTESRSYDELNRLTQITDALDGATTFAYDLQGHRLSVTDAEGKVWAFAYDDLGRLKTETDHSGNTTTYQTDQAGNVYQKTNRLNEITQTTFDTANRPTRTDYPKDATWETYGYDAAGNLASMANANVTYTFDYDLLGRPLAKHDSRGKSLSFSYDQAGNILTKTTYQGSTTRYQYNAANRLVQLVNPDYLQVNYQYDPAGRMLSRIMSSGARSSYQYDANGRLLHQAQHDAHGALIADTLYTRDRLGHVLTQTDLGAPTTYAYDALYRLTSADYPGTVNDEVFTYDKVGNRLTTVTGGTTTRVYSYTAGINRLAHVRRGGPTAWFIESRFTYDDEGRLTSQTGIGAKTLTWDAKGRLKTLTQSGLTETYTYDPTDQRIARSGGSLGSLDYYQEGEHLESVHQSGTLQEKYFRGSSIDELVAGYLTDTDGKLKPYLYHQDALTSTTQVSGHNGGTLQGLTYGAFGTVQASTGASPNRLKYTGREEDGTGLIFYRARYYDPRIGRFISEDPLGFGAGDVNFYAYVGNDPVNNNDPSGLVRWGDAGMASINFLSNAAGSFVGGTIAVTGAGLLAAPEPILTKAGGVAAIGFGGTIAGKSIAGMGMNIRNLVDAIQDRPASVSGSLAEAIAGQVAPGNANAKRTAQIIDLGLDLATGRVRPDKMMTLSKGIPGLKWGTAEETIEASYGAAGKVFNRASGFLQGSASIASIINSGQEIAGYLNPVTSGRQTMHSFEQLSAPGATGGAMLYPSKSNTNMLQSVYRK